MKHIKTICSGLLAGIIIGLGGLIFSVVMAGAATVGERILAAFLFSIGLLLICIFGLNLYTGKIGYVFDNKPRYIIDLGEMLLGNLLGAGLMGLFMRGCSSQYTSAIEKLGSICEAKFNHPWYTLLLLAMGCGILVYFAVAIFKSEHHPVLRIAGLMICVTTFVATGLLHVIAEMFYLVAANKLDLNSILYLFIILVGNSVGSIVLHELIKLINKKEKVEVK